MAKKLRKLCVYFHATNLYTCPNCGCELRNFQKELRAKVDAVPIEIKQKILDGLKTMNVGDSIKASGFDGEFLVASTIIADQIETSTYSWLREKAI